MMVVKKRKNKNLNHLIHLDDQKKRRVVKSTGVCEYVFDDIFVHVHRWLNDSKCRHVAMLCPYTSDRDLLSVLSLKESCTLVTINDKWSKSRHGCYSGWTPFCEYVLYTLQNGSGYNKNIMHSKVIILMDKVRVPYGVIIGSCNFSGGSSSNIEHVMYIKDKKVAGDYLDEFHRVVSISKPVKQIY